MPTPAAGSVSSRSITPRGTASCGTSLVSRPGVMPGVVIIKVGTLDDPSQYGAPDMAFFMEDSQSFHYLPEGLPTFDRFPG